MSIARVTTNGIAATIALAVVGVWPWGDAPNAVRAASPQRAPAAGTVEPARAEQQKKRVDDRLAAIGQEADALVVQERSLLEQLQALEVERAARQDAVTQAERELEHLDEELSRLNVEIAELEARLEGERPAIEQRLVALYKRGPLQSTRLLLDLPKARDLARAYRGIQGVAHADQRRFRAFERDREALVAKGQVLAERSAAVAEARGEAEAARADLSRAIARQSSAIAAIDARRDLSARLARELSDARVQLDHSLAGLGSVAPVVLPVEAFRGAFEWPVGGAVIEPFGRQRQRYGTQTVRNGVTIAAPAGTPAKAVHEGRVAFAAPFAGFGLLVIVDHGGQDFSLYGQLSSLGVSKGDAVDPGAVIGHTGTGPRGTPGLYFELRVDGSPVDPVEWLKRVQP